MIDEYDIRVSLCPTSSTTLSSAPAITRAVIGSISLAGGLPASYSMTSSWGARPPATNWLKARTACPARERADFRRWGRSRAADRPPFRKKSPSRRPHQRLSRHGCSELGGCAVIHRLRVQVDHHAVLGAGRLRADELVENVVEHLLRITLERVAIAGRARAYRADHVSRLGPARLKLLRQ